MSKRNQGRYQQKSAVLSDRSTSQGKAVNRQAYQQEFSTDAKSLIKSYMSGGVTSGTTLEGEPKSPQVHFGANETEPNKLSPGKSGRSQLPADGIQGQSILKTAIANQNKKEQSSNTVLALTNEAKTHFQFEY